MFNKFNTFFPTWLKQIFQRYLWTSPTGETVGGPGAGGSDAGAGGGECVQNLEHNFSTDLLKDLTPRSEVQLNPHPQDHLNLQYQNQLRPSPRPQDQLRLSPRPGPTKAITPSSGPAKAITPSSGPAKAVTPSSRPTKAVTPSSGPTPSSPEYLTSPSGSLQNIFSLLS